MKVPFHLKRVSEVRPATALLLPVHDAGLLLRMCSRLRLDLPPQVFAVADGFLVCFGRPSAELTAEGIRLCEAGNNLFVPVDAELVPALLPDEAAALGRQRGLVFLPEGRVLEFAPEHPVPWCELLEPRRLSVSSWHALPAPAALAETLSEIEFEHPEVNPDDLLKPGGEGIGVEDPRPDDATLPKKMLGHGAMGLGKGLTWLGKLLHLQSLVRAGGKAMGLGLSAFPRLSEKLLGKQRAGLRELLRQLREGDVDKALRRAVPLTPDMGRGGGVYQGTQLPTNDIRYSLANILGGLGGVPLWFSEGDLWRELEQEYRRQAEAASKRGDHRRAAFIYGKLLGDYRLAAAVLGRGGLHHDAAILYLKIVKDFVAAAQQFELAGDLDRALDLYRQRGEHVRAGDLLRRMGEEDLAIAEYKHAADLIVQSGQGHYQAGELMLHKAQRPDLAREFYRAGWELRPAGSPLACARQLARLHVEAAEASPFLELVGEAEEFYRAPGNDADASAFFNEIAGLARRPALAEQREQLHDRTLMMLAHKLRQNASYPQTVSQLFPPGEIWPAILVGDAGYAAGAAAAALRAPPPRSAEVRTSFAANVSMVIQGVIPVVRAVCQAYASKEVFLGFESGEIACLSISSGSVTYLEKQDGPIHNLVARADGALVAALSGTNDPDELRLSCQIGELPWRQVQSPMKLSPASRWHLPSEAWPGHRLGLWDNERAVLKWLRAPSLVPEDELALADDELAFADFVPSAILQLTAEGLLAFDGQHMLYLPSVDLGNLGEPHLRVPCPFPRLQPATTLDAPPLSALRLARDSFELAGLGEGGSLCWLRVNFDKYRLTRPILSSAPGPYLAATLAGPGRIVAVDAKSIVYLHAAEGGIKEQSRHLCSLPNAVACFVSQANQEVIVVSGNGSVSRTRLMN